MNTGLNRTKWEPYIWLLPSLLLISIFVVFPILIVFKLSFSEISKAGVIGGFVGFDNYVEAVHLPAFKTVMLNTLWWVLSVVILSTVLGFIIAMVLNQKFRGRKIARSILVFPWATSLVIQASVWNYIIKYEYGNLNNVLLNLGIIQQAINWRSSYQIEFVWECWVGIFVTVPFVTFCVLSGLQSIDDSLYEAAIMDGAGFWDKLRHVTLPMVKPSLTVSTVLNIIYVFNSFPIVYTMTKGAPAHKTDTMITYLYMLSFYERKKGPAISDPLPLCRHLYDLGDEKGGTAVRFPEVKQQNRKMLILFLAGLILTLILMSLPLYSFDIGIYTKKSANTFVGDEKYQTVRAEVEEVAEDYRAQGFDVEIQESVLERVNSKGKTTAGIFFPSWERAFPLQRYWRRCWC